MKTNDLHKQCQDTLRSVIEDLVTTFQPMSIYSFSEISKRTEHTGTFVSSINEQHVHHFLLMVMESATRNEHEVQDFCNQKFLGQGKITILSHGLATVEESVSKNNRFFITILNKGHLLYNKNGLLLDTQLPFDPNQNYEKAKKHYSHRLKLIQGFLHSAEETHLEGYSEVAVFLMHQIIEQSTIVLLRVNLAYRSDIHHLGRQLDLCCCFSSEPSNIFRNTKGDQRLFEILLRSYSQARYKDNFIVDYYDAEKLLAKVKDFVALTDQICTAKIAEFEKDRKKLEGGEVKDEK